MGNVVALRVNGREYRGWKSARVTRSIEQISGSFELTVSERWETQGKPWPIGEGDDCVVMVNGQTVITGHIDDRDLSFGADDHSTSLSGRDATGDLVDSSVFLDKWEFKNVSVPALAQKICDPHGIKVSLQPGLVLPPATIPKKFSIDPGDTASTALENVCRVAGLLAMADGYGGLLLTRAGTERTFTELVQGSNILKCSAKYSLKNRFRKYVVMGQHKGSDASPGATVTGIKGECEDLNVARLSRVHVTRPEGMVTAAHAQTRAEWEAITRAARADAVSIVVQGWTQADGQLWKVNTRVRVRAPIVGADGDMLITAATYSLGVDSGETTTLELRRPNAFLPEPLLTKDGGANYWKELIKPV